MSKSSEKMLSIENELKQVSELLEMRRSELEQLACRLEPIHQDVVSLSQTLDQLILRFMKLKRKLLQEKAKEPTTKK
ncbi:Spo0E family sporulation regulatory protein-aspartic acid phosphatase [Paenibacillus sp. NPDC093718]|uniref:Spo0E family sporulation regulatory protein-aspartic acid phosphatase n=1 Tax=Paenibacillus sp. NPDC093718 TaxID=3390601 RepID=UPI003CFFAB7A